MIKRFAAAAALVLLLSACSGQGDFKPELDYKVEDFSHIDQRGRTVSLDDLKGHIWLSAFIFTNCKTVCPPMTANLASLQKKLQARKLDDYRIVLFSVDPATDTPEKLKAYLSHYNVPDASKWELLTGYKQADIEQFAVKSFKTLVKKPEEGDQVLHGTSFSLVDQAGTVVKSYSGVTDVQEDAIAIDMEALSKQKPEAE